MELRAQSQEASKVQAHGNEAVSVACAHRNDESAGYLLPHLRPGLDVLDVGCGPGTITLDLASRLTPGRVLGIDTSAEVTEQARALADSRAEFAVRARRP